MHTQAAPPDGLAWAGYYRVSTDRQSERGLSTEEQQRLIREHVAGQGGADPVMYGDVLSGRRVDRPGYQRLLADAQARRFDRLVVWKLDRFGRDMVERLSAQAMLRTFGVEIVSLTEPSSDPDAAFAPVMEAVLAGLAEAESRQISERTRMGKAASAAKGKPNGGPRTFGYEPDKLTPRAAEVAILGRMRAELLAGATLGDIAAGLNRDGVGTVRGRPWSQARIGQMLRNACYAGWRNYRGELVPGRHQAVFSQGEFDEIQACLDARGRRSPRAGGRPTSGSHIFVRGLLRCGRCGSSMCPRTTTNSQGRRYEMYRCLGQLQRSADCNMPSVPRAALDVPVLSYFERIGLDVDETRRHFAEQMGHRVEEVRTQADRAEREAIQATASVEKAEAEWAAGELGGKAYERLAAKYDEQRRAAEAEALRLRDHERALAEDAESLDAEEEALRYLADLRAAIAGTVTEAGSVPAVRAALLRLFDGFTLHSYEAGVRDDPPLPEGWARSRLYFEPELLVVGGFHIEPHPRTEIVLDADKEIEFPQVTRTGLVTRETTVASRR